LEILVDHLEETDSAYKVRLFAYTLMSNHIHLLLQAPTADENKRCPEFPGHHTLFLGERRGKTPLRHST